MEFHLLNNFKKSQYNIQTAIHTLIAKRNLKLSFILTKTSYTFYLMILKMLQEDINNIKIIRHYYFYLNLMNLETFIKHVKKNKVPLNKGHQQLLFDTASQYGSESPQTRQAVQASTKKVYVKQLMELIKEVFPALGATSKNNGPHEIAKSICAQCIDRYYLKPQDARLLLQKLIGLSEEKYDGDQTIKIIKEIYGFDGHFSQGFKQIQQKLAPIITITDPLEKQSSLKQFFAALQEKILTYSEDIREQQQQIKNLEEFKQAAKKKRIFIKPQFVNELYESLLMLGVEQSAQIGLINKSTYKAFESELFQLSTLVEMKYQKCLKEIRNILRKQNFIFQEKTAELIKLYFSQKDEFQTTIKDFQLPQQSQHNIKQLLGSLLDNIPNKLHQKFISNFNQYVKQIYSQEFIFQEIKQGLKLLFGKLALQMSVEQEKIQELFLSFAQADSDYSENFIKSYGLQNQKKDLVQLLGNRKWEIQKYFEVFEEEELIHQSYTQFVKRLVQQAKSRKPSKSLPEIKESNSQKMIQPKQQLKKIETTQQQILEKHSTSIEKQFSEKEIKTQQKTKKKEQKKSEPKIQEIIQIQPQQQRLNFSEEQDLSMKEVNLQFKQEVQAEFSKNQLSLKPSLFVDEEAAQPKHELQSTMFLIIISKDKLQNLKVKRYGKDGSKIEVKYQIQKIEIKPYCLTYLKFPMNHGKFIHKVYVKKQKIWKNLEINFKGSLKFNNLSFKLENQTESKADSDIVHSALFYSIKPIIFFNKKSESVSYFPFLHLLYNALVMQGQKFDEEKVFEFIKKYLFQDWIISRLFLLLFKAYYGQKAEQKYYQLEIYKKIKFYEESNYVSQQLRLFQGNPLSKKSIEVERFYFGIHYYHELAKSKPSGDLLTKLLQINLKIQTEKQSLNILKRSITADVRDKVILTLIQADSKIANFLRQSEIVTAFDYFFIRSKYLPGLLLPSLQQQSVSVSSRYSYQQKIKRMIQTFLDDLINKCCSGKTGVCQEIQSEGVQSIFTIRQKSLFSSNRLRYRLQYGTYYEIVKRLKVLQDVSGKSFKFISHLEQYLKLNNESVTKQSLSQIMGASIIWPCSQFDKNQLKHIFQYCCHVLNQSPFIEFLQIISKQSKYQLKFDIEHFLELISTSLSKADHEKVKRQKILSKLASLAMTQHDHNKKALFQKLFSAILKAFRISNSYISNKLKYTTILKNYFEEMFCMKQPYKTQLQEHLMQQLKLIGQQCDPCQFYRIFKDIYQKNIERQELLIKIYVAYFSPQQAQAASQHFWEHLQKNIELIQIYSKYHFNFVPAYNKIIERIKTDCIYLRQLDSILSQVKQKPSTQLSLNQLVLAINFADSKYKLFTSKLHKTWNLLECFNRQKIFENQRNDINKRILSLNSTKLVAVYQEKEYSQLLQKCEQIYRIRQSPLWNRVLIKDLESFFNQFQRVHDLIHKNLQKLFQQQMLYSQYLLNFSGINLKDVVRQSQYFKNENSLEFVDSYQAKTNLQYIKRIIKFSSALVYISQQIKGKTQTIKTLQYLNSKLKQLEQKMQDIYLQIRRKQTPDKQLRVKEIVKVVDEVQNYLVKIYEISPDKLSKPLSQNLTNQVIAVILASTFDAKQMFDFINDKEINIKLVNDLKLYIHDLENTNVEISLIKQFETVVQYWWQIIKVTDSMQVLISSIKSFIQRKTQLAQNIKNCFTSFKSLRLLIQKVENQEISFKYEIQDLLANSQLFLNEKLDIQVKVYTNSQIQSSKLDSPGKQRKPKQTRVLEYKQMSQYRDQSLLLINNISKQQVIDKAFEEMFRVLKKYVEFFAIVEIMKTKIVQLTNYGYNPKEIKNIFCEQILIKNQDFNNINSVKIVLELQSQQWIKEIKKHYQNWYLLTHFIGIELNNFIQDCINQKYHPSLSRIIYISQENFQKEKLNKEFKQSLQQAQKAKPLQRIKHVREAFGNFDQSFFDTVEISIYGTKPITMIHCSKNLLYYTFLQKNQKQAKLCIAQPSQILFCHQATNIQQIEVFLYRALIHSKKHHYVLGPSKLKQQVKFAFCNRLTILLKQNQDVLKKSMLCFVDWKTNDQLYSFLNRPKVFQIEKKQIDNQSAKESIQKLVSLLPETLVIESRIAGLGKTFFAEKRALASKKQVKYMPLGGNLSLQKLAKRLQKLNIGQNNLLLIQIGHVENKEILQIFLSQIIFFRCFFYNQFIFIPERTSIYIEIENVRQQIKSDKQEQPFSNTIEILKRHNKVKYIQKFQINQIEIDSQNYEDKFVFIYLDIMSKPEVDKIEGYIKDQLAQNAAWYKRWFYYFSTQKRLVKLYSYTKQYQNQKRTKQLPTNTKELIKKYFCDWLEKKDIEPNHHIFKSFKKMLFTTFKTFSDYPQFHQLKFKDIKNLKLQNSRSNFLEICLENTLQCLAQKDNLSRFAAKTDNKLCQIQLLIVSATHQKESTHRYIYLSDKKVPMPIKTFLLHQNAQQIKEMNQMKDIKQFDEDVINQLFKKLSLSEKKGDQLELQMFKIIYELTGNSKFAAKNAVVSKQQEGTIKQIQIKLANIYENVPKLKSYKLTLDNFFKLCLIIHRTNSSVPCIIMGESGVGKTALIQFLVKSCFEEELFICNIHAGIHEEDLFKFQKEAKQLQKQNKRLWVFFDEFNTTDELFYIKQMVMDRRFLGQKIPENIVFLAACNPYRQRVYSQKVKKGGISKGFENSHKNLAFIVKPPPLSMTQLMWDYKQLNESQNRQYITKILSSINYSKKKELIESIVSTHQHLKSSIQVSSVSLRDVARFKELYNWFLLNKPSQNEKVRITFRNSTKLVVQDQQKAVILTFIFCYVLRFPSNKDRNNYLNKIQQKMGFQRDYMKKVLQYQQRLYIKMLKLPDDKIAYNAALRENIFTSLVCIMNKIPVLIIGNPGSSKSLSIKMLNSNLRGQSSKSDFCKNLPQINMVYFQGSESSTSKGVQQLIQTTRRKQQNLTQKLAEKMLYCILFDEIGLAEKSVHNPLKVLHSQLQVNKLPVGFIGISNWQLDAAKMSRLLVISHSNPDQQELCETAVQLARSFLGDKFKETIFIQAAKYYSSFIMKWNNNKDNRANFFGLRDFYCYIKFVCDNYKAIDANPAEEDRILSEAIQINFDGQTNSIKVFSQTANIRKTKSPLLLNPIELLNKNVNSKNARCLMFIIKGDSLIPIVKKSIKPKSADSRVVCLYGSTFQQDNKCEDYNLSVTSTVISHVSRGNILVFKDINNSIQTSLYDLFNKSYSQIGTKQYCKISVGAHTNPRCYVHQNFNAIVYVDEEKVKKLDLAFLNRFQKHFLNINNIITEAEKSLVDEIQNWLNQLLQLRFKESLLKKQNLIINCSQQSIVSLVLKYREEDNKVDLIKTKLLQNRTTDFTIAMIDDPNKKAIAKIDKYLEQITQVDQCEKDMIIFTYDQTSILAAQQNFIRNKCTKYIISLAQIKSEASLRNHLKKGLTSQQYSAVEIKLRYQSHFMHINFLLFLSKEVKTQMKSNKQIIIIIQLQRCTLHHLNLQHINISYLHEYQQYFIQNTHSKDMISNLIASSNCWELFSRLKMQDYLVDCYIETIKLIKLNCQSFQDEKLKKVYFNQINSLSTNKQYHQQLKMMLKHQMQNEQVNFSAVQRNNQEIKYCSNIQEALGKYLQNMIKEINFITLKYVVQEGLLFFYDQRRLFKHVDQKFLSFVQKNYKQSQNLLKQMIKIQLNQAIKHLMQSFKDMRRRNIYRNIVQNNLITIKNQITLIPTSDKDFSLLLTNNQAIGSNSLQDLSTKLPFPRQAQFSLQQYNLNLDQCKNFIADKFKIKENEFFEKIKANKGLLRLYLFDLLTFYLKENNAPIEDICDYIDLICQAFTQFSLQQILIMMTKDKRFFIEILTLLSILLKNAESKEKNSKENAIKRIGQIPHKQIDEAMIDCMKIMFEQCFDAMVFTRQNINKTGYQVYLSQFKAVFLKIRQIINIYRHKDLDYDPNFLTLSFLFETLSKINLTQKQNNFLQQFIKKDYKEKEPIHPQIFNLIQAVLKMVKESSDKQILINYLSLRFFIEWIEHANNTEDENYDELKLCVQQFVEMCNSYVLFANNAKYFIGQLLPEFEQIQSIDQMINYVRINYNKLAIKQQQIDFQSNFAITLGNYISGQICHILQSAEKQKLNESNYDAFICNNYRQIFRQSLQTRLNEVSKLETIVQFEFLKLYGASYIQLLTSPNQQNQLLEQIDNLLKQECTIVKHLKIYLLKIIYNKYQTVQAIKANFFEKQRCEWIFTEKSLFQQVRQIYYPPRLLPPNHFIFQLMKFNQETKFSNAESKLQRLIVQGLKGRRNTYQLLTFFLYKFYVGEQKNQLNNQISIKLRKMQNLNLPKNRLVLELLLKYLGGKISQSFTSAEDSNQILDQLPYLNYLNLIIAFRQKKCPFIQMFFNIQGFPFKDYWKEFESRYLLGSLQNPSLKRLNFIVKRQSLGYKARSYVCCSNKCYFLVPVGGNFYGSDDSNSKGSKVKCGLCGEIIIVKKNYFNFERIFNMELREFQSKQLKDLIPTIKTLEQFKIPPVPVGEKLQNTKSQYRQTYKLKGYQNGNTIKHLQQNLKLKMHLARVATDQLEGHNELIGFKILQSIIYFVWYFLAETNDMDKQSLLGLFKYQVQQSKKFLQNASKFYFDSANESLNLVQKQDIIVWHLGMGKILSEVFQNFGSKSNNTSIENYDTKVEFQSCVHDKMFPYFEKQKQKFIKSNRFIEKNTFLNLFKQIGNYEKNNQYLYIKLFKFQNRKFFPCYQNLKNQFKTTLSTSFPILNYIMNNDETQRKLKDLKCVYVFISKLWKIFNLRIKREEAEKELGQMYLKSTNNTNEQQINHMKQELGEFIAAWNQLLKSNYQLTYAVSSEDDKLGKLEKISLKTPIKNFFLDKTNRNNIFGLRLIAFIQVSAKEYNQICSRLQNLVKSSSRQQVPTNIFSSIPLNPTLLNKDANLLSFPRQFLEDKINKYSSYSVQYGVSMPIYAFDHIQSMVAKTFYGCRYLIDNPEKFCYITYIGEQVHFITELREDPNQKTLQQTNMKDRVVEFFKKIQKEQSDECYKTIKNIQGSLQSIVIFFKNLKSNDQIYKKTIKQFLTEKQIKSEALLKEPFQSLPLSNLVDFYQFVEFYTFQNASTLLDPKYKAPFKKGQTESLKLKELIEQMKKEQRRHGVPSYSDFKIGLYRLAGRNLQHSLTEQNKFIAQQLCLVPYYWPKHVKIQDFQNPEPSVFYQTMAKIQFSKVGALLNQLPFRQDRANTTAKNNCISKPQTFVRPQRPQRNVNVRGTKADKD